jgi:hypothetical protein
MRHGFCDHRFGAALAAAVLAFAVAAAGPAAAVSPCTCRHAGASYDLDACVCIDTPSGARMACCGKVLNNTSWRFTDARCPTARLPAADAPPSPPGDPPNPARRAPALAAAPVD